MAKQNSAKTAKVKATPQTASAERESTTIRKAAMLKALEECLGVVSDAATMAGVHRDTHRIWMNTDADYASKVADLKTVAHDFGVSCLHKSMKRGNVAAIIFYLKTQCKHLGYVERTEHIVETTESLANRMDFDQAKQLLNSAGITVTEKQAALTADE